MKTGAGMLRERVRFDQRKTVLDGAGNEVGAWVAMFPSVAARLKPINGSEEIRAARLAGLTGYEITVRSSTETRTVSTECRAVNTRTCAAYNIKSIVNPDENAVYLIMTAEQGGNDG